ncbi:hypothetical protein MHBO_000448 [Bonamia ostreae]|uniref:Uncharacterized protein n=1 Tax=Bonamia ostreae TaxID=126728 RepID=A0ABV2AFM6_9EUKA
MSLKNLGGEESDEADKGSDIEASGSEYYSEYEYEEEPAEETTEAGKGWLW